MLHLLLPMFRLRTSLFFPSALLIANEMKFVLRLILARVCFASVSRDLHELHCNIGVTHVRPGEYV